MPANTRTPPLISDRPAWLTEDRYPFQIRHLGTGQDQVAYTDAGSGPTLLFVHIGTWSFVWRDLITRLHDTHRCVTIDAPATGFSGGHPPRHATIEHAAAAITRVVEALDLHDLVLVLHDLGGPATLLAARGWPDRVRGLVAVNTFGWRPTGPLFRGMLAVMGSAPMRGLDVATGFLPWMTSGRFGVGLHLQRADRRAFRRGMGRRGRASFHRYMRDTRHADFATIEASLDVLSTLPMLTIFGSRSDPLSFQPTWAERCPLIRQVEVPKGNHFPMCDAPDLVATAIRTWHAETAGEADAQRP